jgi:hypothetical protein
MFLSCVSILLVVAGSFRVQSYVFARRVRSVLRQMERIELEKTSQEEVLAAIRQLKPGLLWSFADATRPREQCPGDLCLVLHIQNWPNGMLANLREKLNYHYEPIFKAAYWLGHRFVNFGVYVEIRDGRVSRYEYSFAVEDGEFPGNGLVEIHALGANRASYPRGFGFMRDYETIGDFRIKAPSNRPTKVMYVAFTPEARAEEVQEVFDLHLDCV